MRTVTLLVLSRGGSNGDGMVNSVDLNRLLLRKLRIVTVLRERKTLK